MWFNNIQLYSYTLDENMNINELLTNDCLKPCPAHARFIHGWTSPVNNDVLAYEIANCYFINLGKEEKILPRSVIQRVLAEKIKKIEVERGFPVKKIEQGQLAEDIEFDLLPKAFCVQKNTLAILDKNNKKIIVNSSSNNQSSQLLSLLRKSIPEISIEPIDTINNMAILFASWIKNPGLLPKNFDLATNCLLFSEDNEHKQFNCKGYELPADEIHSLLEKGLVASEISLVWNERIQFTLTQNLTLKRIKCLDYLIDEFHEAGKSDNDTQQQDASLTLLIQELRSLFADLLPTLTQSDKINPLPETCNI